MLQPYVPCSAAALILTGLVAEGVTRVTELKHLDRGYVDIHKKLAALDADVERVNDVEEVVIEDQKYIADTNA